MELMELVIKAHPPPFDFLENLVTADTGACVIEHWLSPFGNLRIRAIYIACSLFFAQIPAFPLRGLPYLLILSPEGHLVHIFHCQWPSFEHGPLILASALGSQGWVTMITVTP